MNTFFPVTASEAEWNAAYYRLEDYFRSLRVVNKVHQSQLILHILEAAAARHATDTSRNPTELAMEEARSTMNQWFEGILGVRERLGVEGVLAYLAVDAPSRWPTTFLSEEVPAEFLHEMQESDLRAGPDLAVSSMVPRAIDVGALLTPVNLPEVLEKARTSIAIFAMVLLAALSVSLFFIMH